MKRSGGQLRRLEKAEALLGARARNQGRLEWHFLDAWPDCQDEPGFHQCLEHAPSCGVKKIPTGGNITRQIIFRGDELLNID